jgi:hypothetical protein
MASTANPHHKSLTLHEAALVDTTDREAYRAKFQQDEFQIEAEFIWATLEPHLSGETSPSSISSHSSCRDAQSDRDSSTTSNDTGYGDDRQFLVGILREAGLVGSRSKERQREHRYPAETRGLKTPGHGMSGSQFINRNAIRCSGTKKTHTETSPLEYESFAMDTARKQCRPSNTRTFPGERRSEDVTTDSIRSSHYCGLSPSGVCGKWSSDCLIISVHRRGVVQQVKLSQPITTLLPQSPSERAAIGANIWRAFEAMKERNESERDLAIQTRRGKPLREVAPIPWLRWRTKSGKSGQFRSKQNFETWWSSNVVANGEDPGTGVVWLMVQL